MVGHTEVSRNVVSVSLIKSQGSEKKLMLKAERQRQIAVSTPQWLLKIQELFGLDELDFWHDLNVLFSYEKFKP